MIEEAASLLQISMESAASLLGMYYCVLTYPYILMVRVNMYCTICFPVPLQVKLKVGRTWGSLKPFEVGQCKMEVLVLDS